MSEEFAAAPKVVKPKNKYKEEEQQQEEDEIKLIYNNLMWDKRVFRGNTYSAIVVSKKNDAPYDNNSRLPLGARHQPSDTAKTYDGHRRANIEIFTDEFVNSLTDKPPHYQYASQTEPLPDATVLRHRMDQKLGSDTETQIWDNQLFDFDYEAEPLLNVLCGRTLEMSRMEMLQEEELLIMSHRQQELRLCERDENKKIQSLYAAEDKLEQENTNRLEGFMREKEKKIKTHRRVFSRVIAKQYLRDIKPNTLKFVEGNGFFRHHIDYRLSSELLPALYQDTSTIAKHDAQVAGDAELLLLATEQEILKQHSFAKEMERTRRKAITDKRQERVREKEDRQRMGEEERMMRVRVLVEEEEERARAVEEARRAGEEGAARGEEGAGEEAVG